MIIRAGFTLTLDCPAETPMVLALNIHPSRRADLLTGQTLTFDPGLTAQEYCDVYGNACTRLVAPAGVTTIWTDFTIYDSGRPDPFLPDAVQHAVPDLPDDTLGFLLGSRYCETDRLSSLAWSLFGDTAPGWPRVQAVCDFVHNELTFDYGRADPTRTACGAYQERVGVCRDFAHLAITFCRCLNIPARYCTGYLGDIGVPPAPDPMDFSAWFEVFIGGRWVVFDARHNRPRIGRLLVARGRDAADVALTTSFGEARLAGFEVVTEEIPVDRRWFETGAADLPAPAADPMPEADVDGGSWTGQGQPTAHNGQPAPRARAAGSPA